MLSPELVVTTSSVDQNKEEGVGKKTNRADKPAQKVVPNHFVAIQVRNPKIHYQVGKVQQLIIGQNKAFEKANISLPTLHITLAVMFFDAKDTEVVARATNAMEVTLTKIRQSLNAEPLNMVFRGLDNFSNKVLFAKIDSKETLNRVEWISNVVKEAFAVEGVTVKDEELSAHLTVMKLSNMSFKERKVFKKIDPVLYAEALEVEFGDETVTGLQLLSMNEPKDEHGYYRCLKEVFIQ